TGAQEVEPLIDLHNLRSHPAVRVVKLRKRLDPDDLLKTRNVFVSNLVNRLREDTTLRRREVNVAREDRSHLTPTLNQVCVRSLLKANRINDPVELARDQDA